MTQRRTDLDYTENPHTTTGFSVGIRKPGVLESDISNSRILMIDRGAEIVDSFYCRSLGNIKSVCWLDDNTFAVGVQHGNFLPSLIPLKVFDSVLNKLDKLMYGGHYCIEIWTVGKEGRACYLSQSVDTSTRIGDQLKSVEFYGPEDNYLLKRMLVKLEKDPKEYIWEFGRFLQGVSLKESREPENSQQYTA